MKNLEEDVLFLRFQLVGAKDTQPTQGLIFRKTGGITLKESEDIFDEEGLQVNFLFVVKIFGGELNLGRKFRMIDMAGDGD